MTTWNTTKRELKVIMIIEDHMPEKEEYSRAELAQIILDEMYQLVGILDSKGINLLSNQTSLDAAGVKREDVIGKYFWETPWWPDDVRQQLKEGVEKAIRGEFV